MYEIKVEGMDCSSCANSIAYALKSIDAAVEVSVDIKSQTVRVKSSQDESAIKALIEEAGYPVRGSRKMA